MEFMGGGGVTAYRDLDISPWMEVMRWINSISPWMEVVQVAGSYGVRGGSRSEGR